MVKLNCNFFGIVINKIYKSESNLLFSFIKKKTTNERQSPRIFSGLFQIRQSSYHPLLLKSCYGYQRFIK